MSIVKTGGFTKPAPGGFLMENIEEIKLSLFTDGMINYIENLKESTKKSPGISNF